MDQEYSEALGLEAEKETPEKEQTETAETAAPQEAEAPETERKPVMSQEERARQAAGRRLREREAAARSAARAEIADTLRRRGVLDPRTGRPVGSLEELEREQPPLPGRTPTQDPRVTRELEEIRRMDPEMEDLGCILRSESGERFRRYVRRGLSFVEAYTLAARDRLDGLREEKAREAARVKAASKDHLNATSSTGLGALPVPGEEMALFRELMPGVAEAEIRRYYNADRKRFGRKEKGAMIP